MEQVDLADACAQLTTGFPVVNDHPDVAGVLRDPELLALLGPALAQPYADAGVTAIMAPEARGPILGALVAQALGVGLVIARKHDRNHPGADLHIDSTATWRGTQERFQARSFDLAHSDRVLLVDDWITTGSSLRAMRSLCVSAGATVVGTSVLVNKADDSTLQELNTWALVDFAAIGTARRA